MHTLSKDEQRELNLKKTKKILGTVLIMGILIIYALFILSPFYVILTTSMTSYREIMTSMSFVWFPSKFDFSSYRDIFLKDPMVDLYGFSSLVLGFWNTMWVSLLTVTVSVLVSGLAAFAYAKMEFKGKNVLFLIQLCTMMIPMSCMTMPSYIFYESLGWTNSYLPIIVPALFGNAACIFFLKSYMTNIPNEVVESAKIDGIGPLGTYFTIILPEAIPAFIAQFIFMFVGSYNNYIGPLLYLYGDDKKYTLQLALRELGNMFSDPNQLCAGALVALLPLILIYIVFQKFFIEGIAVGGGKE